MKETLVINFFGGPGAGKTTAAWEIASELKKRGYVVEYTPEYAKELVWEQSDTYLDGQENHQRALLREQQHRLDRLIGKVDFIVTDSPLLLNGLYYQGSKEATTAYQEEVYQRFLSYNNFCIFINRGKQFEQSGRIHSLEESKKLDSSIKEALESHHIFYGTYSHQNVRYIADNCIKTHQRIQSAPTKRVIGTPAPGSAGSSDPPVGKLDQLVAKLDLEQKKYEDWLLAQPKEEILAHAYEYATREDIALCVSEKAPEMESGELDALLATPDILACVYEDYSKMESSYMIDIGDIVEKMASAGLAQIKEKKKEIRAFVDQNWDNKNGQKIFQRMSEADGNDPENVEKIHEAIQTIKSQIPLYCKSYNDAEELGEINLFLRSLQDTRFCKDELCAWFKKNFDGKALSMKGFSEFTDRFGEDRILLVLAVSIKEYSYDKRISPKNKEWAAKTDTSFLTNSLSLTVTLSQITPGELDILADTARHEMEYSPQLKLGQDRNSAQTGGKGKQATSPLEITH